MPSILAIDFETANQSASSACQLGVVRLEDWKVTHSQAWLIQPPTDEFMFTHIHGITWDHVKAEPRWDELWPQLAPHFRGVDFLAAHNAPFDRGVLRAACEAYGFEAPETPFLDTVQIARKVWKIFPTKLNLVAQHLNIQLQHHEALSDANACAQILVQANAAGWAPPKPAAN